MIPELDVQSAVKDAPLECESEDEDFDFNPFLKESPSEEASSSLSSEVEGLDADDVNSRGGNLLPSGIQPLPKLTGDHRRCEVGDSKMDEGTEVSQEGAFDGEHKKGDSVSILEEGNGSTQDKENGCSNRNDAVENAQNTMTISRKPPIIDLVDDDDDDAICKRTRARYSLAGFTLDELETFLQETDDDDDFQNVDEEEEYRKFLAAVLQGGNGDDQQNLEGNDDDEDNDADFEIEIEEALESDVDDCQMTSNNDQVFKRSSRRPETRQNRRQKANVQSKNRLADKGKRQLRPLLPVRPSAPFPSVTGVGARYPSSVQDHTLNGFMAHQIGQLYCLIYEHVQLLIQIYSLCVLEPSRQHVASQVKGLLSELLHKRDLVLAWRNMPYPSSYFLQPYVHPSVSDGNKTCASSQGNDSQGCRWLPSVGGPVLSVLDVAPVKLVGRYIDDVSNAVREHQRRCVETTNIYLEKQPLFPLPFSPPLSEVNCNVSKENDPAPPNATEVSPNPIVPKKTLAATLVESTKKQSVALVPRQIAKLAQPFYSLFNPALFPHKPPSSAVANRVLFTDAEDELLALGIMQYNNDWKAIQQRFLPCKSEHQIFVRAKNRCSSKAPENSIKAVRKMKTSPLTEEEKARIHEGLKIFKLDWMSIWKFIVPYRDPNLLSRQWRIATGTQKSYKGDSMKRERRRIYEANRRKIKAAAMENSPTGSEKEDDQTGFSGGQNGSGEDCVENDNEAYLHEAFLADWRPPSSGMITSNISTLNIKSRHQPGDSSAERGCEVQKGTENHGNQNSQAEKGLNHEVSTVSEDSCLPHCKSFQPHMPYAFTKSSASESPLHSHRMQKHGISNLVKLAPELPPVKLPPAVRIIPQAFLRTSQLRPSSEGVATASGFQNTSCDSSVVNCTSNILKPVQDSVHVVNPTAPSTSSHKGGLLKTNDRGPDSDPQMHPLLFQTLEEGHLPCCPLKNSSRIPTFSFFPVAQHQLNLTLLQNSHPASPIGGRLSSFKSKESAPTSSSLDFHPLLRRTHEFDAGSIAAAPDGPILSTDLELSRDGYMEDDIVYRAGMAGAPVAAASTPVTPSADANGLDLNIPLSYASRKRKVSSCEGAEDMPTIPSVSAREFVGNGKDRTKNYQYSQPSGHDPTGLVTSASGHATKSGSANNAQLSGNLNGSSVLCINDNAGDQPLLGIVMEQEELSDSDEEVEDVEFECEEMTDSEGEESDSEQTVNAHNKGQADMAVGVDGHHQHSEAAGCGASEGIQPQRKGRNAKSDSMGPGKGNAGCSWLSLNSHGSRSTDRPADGTPAPSYPNRHGKKATLSMKNAPPGEPET